MRMMYLPDFIVTLSKRYSIRQQSPRISAQGKVYNDVGPLTIGGRPRGVHITIPCDQEGRFDNFHVTIESYQRDDPPLHFYYGWLKSHSEGFGDEDIFYPGYLTGKQVQTWTDDQGYQRTGTSNWASVTQEELDSITTLAHNFWDQVKAVRKSRAAVASISARIAAAPSPMQVDNP